MMKTIILPTILLFVLFSCKEGTKADKTGKEGQTMPAFSLQLADSTRYFNTANIPEGQKAAVFIYSPYCPYCRAQIKQIIEDMDRLKDIQFYMVTNFPHKDMVNFYNEFKLNQYKNIVTGRDTAFAATKYFEAVGVPYMAIYDKHKKLSKAYMGQLYTRQILEAAEN